MFVRRKKAVLFRRCLQLWGSVEVSSFLKKINKENRNYKKYSYISKTDVDDLKKRAIEIKNEIDLLSKNINYQNTKKIVNLSNEYFDIKKTLDKYLKYTKKREENERSKNV